VTTTEVPRASCFRPGTKIATKADDVAIESVVEGTLLLTNINSRTGICSDEEVRIEVSDPLLVGFSEYRPGRVCGHGG